MPLPPIPVIVPVLYPYAFLPGLGVRQLCVVATDMDPTKAEVRSVILKHPEDPSRPTLSRMVPEMHQQRADEVASDALETFCSRAVPERPYWEDAERIEAETLKLAQAAEGRWNDDEALRRHPEDECGPAWHPHS